MKDYQDPVIYAGKSISIAELRVRETQDHQKWTKVVETIDSIPSFVHKEDGWTISYNISFRNESSTGPWQTGKVAIELEVVPAVNERFEITVQTPRLYGLDSGRAKAPTLAAPARSPDENNVPITVPRPYWAGSFFVDGDKRQGLRITDALTLNNRRAILHRTFQQFLRGVPTKTCRAEHEGSALSQNNTLRIRIQEQSWANESGDAGFIKEVEFLARKPVGKYLEYQLRGSELVVPDGLGVMKFHQ